jgi:hypothetical protein
MQVLAQNTGLWVALSASYDPARADPDWQAKIAPLSVRCQSLLYTQRLQVDVERLANAERLQRALFAISDIASSDHSTAEVLSGLHEIVGSLMYAENFYIVRFDPGAPDHPLPVLRRQPRPRACPIPRTSCRRRK